MADSQINDFKMFQYTFKDEDPLEEQYWYHGELTTSDAKRILVNDGDFLVHHENGYLLSAVSKELRYHHFRFQKKNSVWDLEKQTGPTIPSLVKTICKDPLTFKSGSGIILKTPVIREEFQLSVRNISNIQPIKRGQLTLVNLADYKSNSKTEKVAVKRCLQSASEVTERKLLREGYIIGQLDHQNIVKFIGMATKPGDILVVMEYIEDGDVLTYVRSNKDSLSTKQLVCMCKHVAKGMAYLESKSCIHRDLAARNCLVGNNLEVKITDFGKARFGTLYAQPSGGTISIFWSAPEVIRYGAFTSMSDVWSFGIFLWEVFSKGESPYEGTDHESLYEDLKTGYRLPAPRGTPDECYNLMKNCWKWQGKDRIKFCTLEEKLGDIYKN